MRMSKLHAKSVRQIEHEECIWCIQKERWVSFLFPFLDRSVSFLFLTLCPVPTSWFDLFVRFISTVFHLVLMPPFSPLAIALFYDRLFARKRNATRMLPTVYRVERNFGGKILSRWAGATRKRRKKVKGKEVKGGERAGRAEILITTRSAQWL